LNRKFKNIASLIFLLVFLLPSIAKLEHHHVHLNYKEKSERNHNVLNEKCSICNFEFSIFSSESENINLQKEKTEDNYCNNYSSQYYSNLSQLYFLLRAPPC